MDNKNIDLDEANNLLKKGYPPLPENLPSGELSYKKDMESFLSPFPFADYLKKIWESDSRYKTHGPAVLKAMNQLLSNPKAIYKNKRANTKQINNLINAVDEIITTIGNKKKRKQTEALMRFAALYHDIGKSIIKERHPVIGWYIVQYMKSEDRDKEKLELLINNEDDFRLLMTIIHDHDQFGVLSTGEASVPILLEAINGGESHEDRKRIISAITLCNLADLIGTIDIDGEATDRIIGDWRWYIGALDYCSEKVERVDEYLVQRARRIRSGELTPWEKKLIKIYPYVEIPNVCGRVRRLVMEASRPDNKLREEFNNEELIADCLQMVFGSENSIREFANQFAYVCKLDYGKRFFEALIQYYKNHKDMSKDSIIYAVFAILKRITITYSAMIRSETGLGNLIGIELKDLTPDNSKEKTTRMIDLIITKHYPGLTWMMSDTPAWYF